LPSVERTYGLTEGIQKADRMTQSGEKVETVQGIVYQKFRRLKGVSIVGGGSKGNHAHIVSWRPVPHRKKRKTKRAVNEERGRETCGFKIRRKVLITLAEGFVKLTAKWLRGKGPCGGTMSGQKKSKHQISSP